VPARSSRSQHVPAPRPMRSQFVLLDRLGRAFCPSALTVALALALLLAFQSRELEERYSEARERLATPYPGGWLPTMETLSVEGRSVSIGLLESETRILAFLRADCEFSLASLPAWKELSARFGPAGGNPVVGLAFGDKDDVMNFVLEHQVPFPIIALDHPRWASVLRVGYVPQTVVITEEGRVVRSRSGLLEEGPPVDSLFWSSVPLPESAEGAALSGTSGDDQLLHLFRNGGV